MNMDLCLVELSLKHQSQNDSNLDLTRWLVYLTQPVVNQVLYGSVLIYVL